MMLVSRHLFVLVLQTLLAAFAPLGRRFLLAKDAGLLIEAATTDLRENPIGLHFLVEALESCLEGLVLFDNNLRHT